MHRIRAFLSIGSISVLSAAALEAQGSRKPPTFPEGVEAVHVNVAVTDAKGRYVTGLSREDFAVFEDGVRQPISLFTQAEVPLTLSLLIDSSGSMAEELPVAQAAAVRFLGTLREGDLAQVVQLNDRVGVLMEFTGDRAALEGAVRSTRASGSTVLYNALYVVLKDGLARRKTDEIRRHAVVLLSDGEDTASVVSDEQVLELARSSQVAVFSICLRPHRATPTLFLKNGRSYHFLTALARETGGQVHSATVASDLDPVYERVAEDLRAQYTLGYVSTNARRDGAWRRIVVEADGREGLSVRHRIGYYGPRTASSAPVARSRGPWSGR